jgi:CheY-like chemotaxis protein
MHILHIDDDPEDCMMFEDALTELKLRQNYTAINSPLEAWQNIIDGIYMPDLIVLDYNMPALNGLELLGLLKQKKETQNIPVVMFTTSAALDLNENSIEAGAIACYVKPISFQALLDLVPQILQIED